MPRYNPQAHTQVFWVTSTLTAGAPTASQISAGTRLDPYMVQDGMAGFTAEGQTIDVTDLAASREKTVPGLATVTPGTITFFRGDAAADAESDLLDDFIAADAAGTVGNIVVVLNGAPLAAKLVDIHPSQVLSVNAEPTAGGTGGRFVVNFSHPSESVINEVIAA